MSNIILFPKNPNQDWASIAIGIKTMLEGIGASQHCVSHVVERLESVHREMQLELSIDIDCDEDFNKSHIDLVIKKIEGSLHQYTRKVFSDRLIVELELCIALGINNES